MSKFLDSLKDLGIDFSKGQKIEKEVVFVKHMQPFFEKAFKDILEKKCWMYRDAVNKGVKFHIYAEFPEKTTEFNVKDQVNSFLEEIK